MSELPTSDRAITEIELTKDLCSAAGHLKALRETLCGIS